MSNQTCPLCQSQQFHVLKNGVNHAPHTDVHVCDQCECVSLSPMPNTEELTQYYAKEYRDVYDSDQDVSARHKIDLGEAKSRTDRLQSVVKASSRVLEIGSGSGAFLSTIAPSVRSVCGIELHDSSREWINNELGLQVYQTLNDLPDGEGCFDVIVMFHVFEHIPDPVDYLTYLSRQLAPGGKIIIEVPNVDDVLVSVYGVSTMTETYFTLAHLYYYAAKTLKCVAENAGLMAEVECVQRYDLSNHLRWALTGKPGGQGFYKEFLTDHANAAYAQDLIKSGKADTLWAICEKQG